MIQAADPAATLDLPEQVTIADRTNGTRTVPGWTAAPGLIITAAHDHDKNPIPRRYQISHAPSGLSIPTGPHCATHVREAVDLLTATGFDWTRDKEALLADKDRLAALVIPPRRLCGNIHTGCPGDPDPWQIRCNTCDWEYDPEDGEHGGWVPTTAKEARSIADDHECDPWLEIKAPNTDKWQPPYVFTSRED